MSVPRSVEECLGDFLEEIEPVAAYSHFLLEAVGLTLEDEIVASRAIPPADCAATDGYAVRAIDTQGASALEPVSLKVIGEIAMGQTAATGVSPGTCLGIGAGVPLPAGADAVVARADTDGGLQEVRINASAYTGQLVKRVGEDVAAGAVVVEKGAAVGPRQIGLLAGLGVDQITVAPRPRVVVISTGEELVEPGKQANPGEVHDANSYLLAATVRAAGGISYRVQVASNNPATFAEVLEDQLVRADLVVVTGGHAGVARAALGRESTIRFEDVAIRPGGFLGHGFMGLENTPVFVLPADPVAAYVSFTVFVEPAIRRLAGRSPQIRPLFRALLETDLRSYAGVNHYVGAEFIADPQGARVRPIGGPGSQVLSDLAAANALIVMRPDVTEAKAGDPVPMILLDRDY